METHSVASADEPDRQPSGRPDGTPSERPTTTARDVRRVDYSGDGLVEADVAESPYLQARAWVDAALAAAEERADVPEPSALSVATVDASGAPDVRTVLMRFFDE